MLSDEDLVEAYLSGNQKGFDEIFKRYNKRVFSYILRMLRDRAAADEVFQETFLRVHKSLDAYRSSERFGCWLFRIAQNTCRDAVRKTKRTQWLVFGMEDDQRESAENPEQKAIRKETRERMVELVEQLGSAEKEIFLLRIHGTLLFREISELLGIPLNTVLARYHKAVQMLKKEYAGTEQL